jgi:DNA polymerase
MVVGEAPGRNEDHLGVPFVGQAGRILNRALTIAFAHESADPTKVREDLFVTNAVKCRPQNNDTPSASDIETCVSAYLTHEIEAVNATALLACGNVAAQALLGETGIQRLRDTWYRIGPDRHVLVTWHPAYVLYRGGYPSEAWDLFYDDVKAFAERVLYGSR